jgi:hypothetical protein
MMSELRIRVYNVHFGDGILVTIDEPRGTRRLLIDVGNLLRGSDGAGDDSVFKAVVEDILAELGGQPVDLYVLTHEHLDHAQGLFLASTRFNLTVPVDRVWLTASAALDYYDRFADAELRKIAEDTFTAARRLMADGDEQMEALFLNNNPTSTRQCIDYLRSLAGAAEYVFRGQTAALGTAKVRVLAPEEDSTVYYGAGMGLAPGIAATGTGVGDVVAPPPGVDVGVYADLLARRRGAVGGNMLAIDKANNNTSVVLGVEWQGWRLIFSGDAEQASWWTMGSRNLLDPVHVLKVSHHGSWNGTPPDELLDLVLPVDGSPDGRSRFALVSTHRGGYDAIPDTPTLDRIASRATMLTTIDDDRLWFELALDEAGTASVRHGPIA